MSLRLLILSEHPTLNEAGKPFSNGLWRYFKAKLAQVGINPDASDVVWANVINKGAGNMFAFLQKGNTDALANFPFIARGWYLRQEFGEELNALYSAIRRLRPNLILAVGDLPYIFLTHQHALKFGRGRVTTSVPLAGGVKVLPCYHPRAVMADLSEEPVLYADLKKAAREMQFPEVRRPQRYLHLRPALTDLEDFWQTFIVPSNKLSVDIETKGTMITCVGVAPSADRALVVPFYDEEKKDGNYWATPREERIAWDFIRRVCSDPTKDTLGQNFSYDVQYLWKQMGIPVPNWTDDTMLLHHALQPEMPKGLGFLASVYTDELAWKFMHKRRAADKGGKKEDE